MRGSATIELEKKRPVGAPLAPATNAWREEESPTGGGSYRETEREAAPLQGERDDPAYIIDWQRRQEEPRREQERNVEPAARSSTTVKEREKRGALRA